MMSTLSVTFNFVLTRFPSTGWTLLDTRAKQAMRKLGVRPNLWILPEGVKVYLAQVRKENFQYYLRGPEGPKAFDSANNDQGGSFVDTANDCVIVESKKFDIVTENESVDPLFQNRSIGGYATMFDTVSENLVGDCDKYGSHMRDIFLYDEYADDFRRISLSMALNSSCRFTEGGDLLWPNNDPNWAYADDNQGDVFVNNGAPCTRLGDLREDALSRQRILIIARSIVRTHLCDVKVAEAMKFLDSMHNKPASDGSWKTWFKSLELGDDGLPKTINSAELVSAGTPYGFGSFDGLKKLKMLLVDLKEDAVKPILAKVENLLDVFDAVYKAMHSLMPSALCFDPSSTPYWLAPSPEAAFFANIFSSLTVPIVLKGATATAAEPSDGVVTDSALSSAKAALQAQVKSLVGSGITYDVSSFKVGVYERVFRTTVDVAPFAAEGLQEANARTNTFLTNLIKYATTFGTKTTDLLNALLSVMISLRAKALEQGKDSPILMHIMFLFQKIMLEGNKTKSADEFVTVLVTAYLFLTEASADLVAANLTSDPNLEPSAVSKFWTATKADADGKTNGGGNASTGTTRSALVGAGWISDDFSAEIPGDSGAQNDYRSGSGRKRTGASSRAQQAAPVFGANARKAMRREPEKRTRFGADVRVQDPETDERFADAPPKMGENTEYFNEKFEYFAGIGSDLERIASLALLTVPLTKSALQELIDNNVPFPFGFVLFRPQMTYSLGTGILTVAGATTGETLIGHTDFQLADNVVQKMHYGNLTMYLKSVVYKPNQVFLADNLFSGDYIGGNDTSMNDVHSIFSDAQSAKKSIYTCLVPLPTYGAKGSDEYMIEPPNPMDCTGAFSSSRGYLRALDNENQSNGRKHYATARFYQAMYGWTNSVIDEDGHFQTSNHSWNTVCFQDHQSIYSVKGRDYSVTIMNTGHWGSSVYPGCGRVRRGMQKYLEQVTFTNAYGMSKSLSIA